MKTKLLLSVLIASCKLVFKTFDNSGILGQYGLNQDLFRKLTQSEPWIHSDRAPVQNAFKALRDGMAAVLGYPPFKVPAEYQAALIYVFVSNANKQAACAWCAGISYPASDLAIGAENATEPTSAEQLWSLCLMAEAECPEFSAKFESKTEKAIRRAARDPKQTGAKE